MTDLGSGSALDQALRRAIIVAADDVSDAQGLIDGAELALVMGRTEDARLLHACAFLLTGFGAKARVHQARIADRIDLPLNPDPETDGVAPDGRPAYAIALEEVAGLMALELPPLPADVGIAEPVALDPSAQGAVPAIAIGDVVPRLVQALHSSGPVAVAALEAVLAELRHAVEEAPVVDLRDHIDADPTRLAELLALRCLQSFLRTNFVLAYSPWGSAALLHAAARLDPAGLGNCLENVPRLARGPRDIVGMIAMDAGTLEEAVAKERIGRWVPLLSIKMPEHSRAVLADAFADNGDLQPLMPMLAVAAMRLPVRFERGLIVRIRDAALDCNDPALAVAAQRLVAVRTNAAGEWIIVGDIHATAGNFEAAEAAYAGCLGGPTPNRTLVDRIEALGNESFAASAVVGGLHTPFARQRMRLARWGAVPARLRGPLLAAQL